MGWMSAVFVPCPTKRESVAQGLFIVCWMSAICDANKKVGVELLYNLVKTGSQAV